MFIQLSRINISGDTEAVFVNPDQIECFFTFKDIFGGHLIEVTKVQFNQGFLLVKEDVGTIASLSYFKD